MKLINTKDSTPIPPGVKVVAKARKVIVTGKRGTLKRDFRHLAVNIEVKNDKVLIEKWFGIKKEIAAVHTVASHIANMIKGVQFGFRYKLKSVYAHFPINMVIPKDGSQIEIRNFLGEKFTRKVLMKDGVKVSTTGLKDEIQLEGNDIELVSKCAALIHQSCLVKNKDIRKFLDGIYVSEKATVEDMDA